MRILVVNAGSSSLKLSVLDEGGRLAGRRSLAAPGGEVDEPELLSTVSALPRPEAVGHRVVHGGDLFQGPVRLDAAVREQLEALGDLAPLHQASALKALETVAAALADVPHVACFDTAFHSSLPEEARTYALPRRWRDRWGLRRYGFHGLSHAYASRRAREWTGARRIVVCHLGSGASLAAVRNDRCVDTTMGFTPLEGLVMGTRSGSVDPGLLLWLLERGHVGVAELADGLQHEAGLRGLAGTADMDEVLARDDDAAALARRVYVHRLRGAVGAMAASLGGLDALVFTGGVGEHAAAVRQDACSGLAFLGVEIDEQRNAQAVPDCDVGVAGAAARVLVVEAREDLEIAREVETVIGTHARSAMREAAAP